MIEHKYPYIPKDLYPAVMYACSSIRKYGTFNVACSTAAKKYGVPVEEVKKHVRARQGAGQRGKTREYKYYSCMGYKDWWLNDYDHDVLYSQICPVEWEKTRQRVVFIVKATSVENMKKQLPSGRLDRDFRLTGPTITGAKWQEFDTRKEAEAYEWQEDR